MSQQLRVPGQKGPYHRGLVCNQGDFRSIGQLCPYAHTLALLCIGEIIGCAARSEETWSREVR